MKVMKDVVCPLTQVMILRSARRSLNLLFAEWGNRGIHLLKVTLNTIALVNAAKLNILQLQTLTMY